MATSQDIQAATNLTKTTSAQIQALLLPDVFFDVVSHLDLYSLVRCQGVCRTWKMVIERSHQARRVLFLEVDPGPFEAFKAAEEHDVAVQDEVAFTPPQKRIPMRPEFRALFNPWIFRHDSEPILQYEVGSQERQGYFGHWCSRGPRPLWRFTDRVSSGQLLFCFTTDELVSLVDQVEASWNKMFLTQPPVKRVLITVQAGYMREEKFNVEKEEGVRIGHVVSCVRTMKAVEVTRKRNDIKDFTTLDVRFDEHFTGVRFMPLQRLVDDEFGNVHAVTS
jgi:hypothetical protein